MAQKNADLITRYRINNLFADLSQSKAIYVSAPGGYGKTIAVSQWMNKCHRTNAIISLDEHDNDPVHFCKRFCAVLHACQPNNTALAEVISHPAFTSAPGEFTLKAISTLTKRKRCVLAIDDLHVLQSNEIIKLLLLFFKRLPDNIQVILINGNDLPPGFSELWLKGQLAYITSKDLLFNNDEISRLYKKRGISLTTEQSKDIFRFTGGWAIGIGALLLSGNTPSSGRLYYLDDFISSSIWDKWEEKTREFLLNTAAAHKLYPSLCEKLTGDQNSEALLKEFVRKGSFIYQTEDGAYHYNNLFRDFLRNKLAEKGDSILFELLCKEGSWYLSEHDPIGAAYCFIRAKNHTGIAESFKLLEHSNRKDLFISAASIIKDPETLLAASGDHPFIFYTMSWLALIEGRIDDMESYLDQYYERYSEIIDCDPSFVYDIYFLYLIDIRLNFKGLTKKITALSHKPDKTVNIARNSVPVNTFTLHRSIVDFSELATDDTQASASLFLKDNTGWLFGHESGQITDCITALLLYEQGHLEKAYTHALSAVTKINDSNAPDFKLSMMSSLVYIMDALGQFNDADNMIGYMKTIIDQNRLYYLENDFHALMVRRQLVNGNIEAAGLWLADNNTSTHDKVNLLEVYLIFTTCRAYIVTGDYDPAIVLLKKVLDFANTYKRPLDVIEAYILLAIAYWKKKRTFQKDAVLFLENAVSIAYEYGYIQMFVNDGAELLSMLQRLKKRTEQIVESAGKPSASFVKMLHLRALEHRSSGLTSGHTEPVMKYTDKQKAVMNLLCKGKSYNEIADELVIKRTTLRSHIALIYKKLGVSNGIDAVKKIKTLNLI